MPIKKPKIEAAEPKEALSYEELRNRLIGTDSELFRINMRREAASELAAYPDSVELLAGCLPNEYNVAVRDAILLSLITIGTDEAAKALIGFLSSEDAGLRNSVIEALQAMPGVMEKFIVNLLKNEDSDIRIMATDILTSLAHPQSPVWLLEVISSETHVNVCAAAVDRLSEIGTPETIPALEKLKVRFPNEPFIGFSVDNAIARILSSGDENNNRD